MSAGDDPADLERAISGQFSRPASTGEPVATRSRRTSRRSSGRIRCAWPPAPEPQRKARLIADMASSSPAPGTSLSAAGRLGSGPRGRHGPAARARVRGRLRGGTGGGRRWRARATSRTCRPSWTSSIACRRGWRERRGDADALRAALTLAALLAPWRSTGSRRGPARGAANPARRPPWRRHPPGA